MILIFPHDEEKREGIREYEEQSIGARSTRTPKRMRTSSQRRPSKPPPPKRKRCRDSR